MDKIQGLSNKEVEEQIQKGNVNTLPITLPDATDSGII